MRLILTTLALLFLTASAKAQTPVFTFECFSNANMTGDSCDICVGTNFQSRSFSGLMVYRLGVFNKWIDEPYLIRLRPGNSVEFIEQTGTNPDKITIPLSQTGFSTITGFIDSTFCAGAQVQYSFSVSDSLRTTAINNLDTLTFVGRGGSTVFFDTVLQKVVITSPVASGGTNLSFSGTSSPVTLNSSTGTDVTLTAGGGISFSATSTNTTITATDQSATNEAQTLTSGTNTVTLSAISGVGGGTVTVDTDPTNDITGSGTINYVPIFTGAQTIGNSVLVQSSGRVGLNATTPAADFTIANSNSSSSGGLRLFEATDAGNYWNIFTGGSGNYDNALNFSYNNSIRTNFIPNDGMQLFDGLLINENNGTSITGKRIRPIQHGNSFLEFFRSGGTGTNGVTRVQGWGTLALATNFNDRLTIDASGNIGVNTATPARLFHVAGAVRITGSAGTPTVVMGRDANGDISNLALSGLSISSGTLSVTNASKWTTGTGGIYNTALDNVSVGSTSVNLSKFRVSGNSANTCGRFDAGTLPDFGASVLLTATGADIYGIDASLNASTNARYLFANSNATANAHTTTIVQSVGGNPTTRYSIVGEGTSFTIGCDNSQTGNPFKIKPGTNIAVFGGLTMDANSNVGINEDTPTTELDVYGSKGISMPTGNTAARPTGKRTIRFNNDIGGFETMGANNVWYRVSSTTAPTVGWNSGIIGTGGTVTLATGSNEVAGTIIITTGTNPTGTNTSAVSLTYVNAYSSGVSPFPIICQANAITATEWNKFHVGTSNSSIFQIGVAAQLAASTTYRINYRITQ